MITLKQESTLLKKLKSLTELELRGVFEELADHIRKNNFDEMVQEVFDLHDLSKDVRSLELEVDELEIEKDRLETRIKDALNILEDIENIDDDVQVEIDKAIQELDI